MRTICAALALVLLGGTGTAQARDALAALCHPFKRGAVVDLHGRRFAPEQAQDPGEPIATVDARQSMLLLPDGRFLLRTSTVYPGDIEFRYRTVGSSDGQTTIDELGWRDGDVLQQDDGASAVKDRTDLRMLVPNLIACDALAAKHETSAGEVRFTDAAGRAVVLRLSAKGEPTEAQIGAETYRYEDWRADAGTRVPTRVKRQRGDRVLAHWTNLRMRMVRPNDLKLLTLPSGYRSADSAGALRATSLGADAYRVDGTKSGYHTGFVVGRDGVVLFDPSTSVDDAKAVRALIEQTAPGRKISYVVLSHVHGDHVAGLPAYQDAEILVGAGGTAALQRQFGDRTPARVREVAVSTPLELGGRSVRIDPIASSHSKTMLIGFDAGSGALFQGDLFYLPERGAIATAFVADNELASFVAREKLPVQAVVGVHGRTGTLTDLQQATDFASRSRRDDRGCVGRMTQSKGC